MGPPEWLLVGEKFAITQASEIIRHAVQIR